MVCDGYYYAMGSLAAALLLGWLTHVPLLAVVPLLLGAFFLWFFRDPDREIPQGEGQVVSCADGVVTGIDPLSTDEGECTRISIFLSVFNVHVNRAPVSGEVTKVEYRRGKYLNAMNPASAELNEQSICTMRTDGGETIIFKQIAGLLARRIVFHPVAGENLERGVRVGLIKFGSRCDVILPVSAQINVRVGDKVRGGSSVLATLVKGVRA